MTKCTVLIYIVNKSIVVALNIAVTVFSEELIGETHDVNRADYRYMRIFCIVWLTYGVIPRKLSSQ